MVVVKTWLVDKKLKLRLLRHMWDHVNAHERARTLRYPKKGKDSIVLTYPLDIIVQYRKYCHIQCICNYNTV
jgi:hypothetical protein